MSGKRADELKAHHDRRSENWWKQLPQADQREIVPIASLKEHFRSGFFAADDRIGLLSDRDPDMRQGDDDIELQLTNVTKALESGNGKYKIGLLDDKAAKDHGILRSDDPASTELLPNVFWEVSAQRRVFVETWKSVGLRTETGYLTNIEILDPDVIRSYRERFETIWAEIHEDNKDPRKVIETLWRIFGEVRH